MFIYYALNTLTYCVRAFLFLLDNSNFESAVLNSQKTNGHIDDHERSIQFQTTTVKSPKSQKQTIAGNVTDSATVTKI